MSLRTARPATSRVVAALVAVVLPPVLLAGVLAEPAAAGSRPPDDVAHLPPVDAPVVDPFRPPATPFGPGNRGLTYDLPPGTPVRATADGLVVFAGVVAGTRHVTVLHADGLRTSYSFLADVSVRRGQQVAQGDVMGTGGIGFHLGARDGDAYLDPAGLFDPRIVDVRLVPHAEPLPPTDAGLLREHAALRELVEAQRPGLLRRMWSTAVEHAAPLVGRYADVVLATWHTWEEIQPLSVVENVVRTVVRHLRQRCTPASVAAPPPADERVALLVGGLGSTSDEASIDQVDVDALGYDRADVLRYRYGGGRVPADGLHPALADVTAAPYGAVDTLDDLEARARELADLVQQVAAARPGLPVDLYAHSMGGLVVRAALLELEGRPGGLEALGEVVTLGTPHSGADLATMAVLTEQSHGPHVAMVRDAFDVEVDPHSTAVRQMAESSAFIDRLRAEGIPEGVSFRTVGARGDLVVTADKTDVAGHPSAITEAAGPGAHAALPGSSATTRELQLALAGLPPACQSLFDAVGDAVVPELVAGATDGAALAMFASA
ncbi:MAG TPA: peptidoglycan DD-metalloendopeptidase family protein [Acidimicrobiales bacterium]|nr:peptidoglycan DD-metalloendopeptidase family protein [Acidimicrobiales bacterium]